MYGGFSSPVGRNMLRCAQRNSCSVEDLLCCSSVRGTVELCVRKRVTADQVRTAGLVQEERIVRLPDAFTVGDFTDIAYRAGLSIMSGCTMGGPPINCQIFTTLC